MNLKNNESLTKDISISIQKFSLKNILDLDIKETWLTLEKESTSSFFLSWKWIGNWLNIISKNKTIILVTAQQNSTVVGLGIFVEKLTTRHFILKSKQWYLHRTGDEKLDQIWIENNDFLLNYRNKDAIRNAMWTHLLQCDHHVDEFILNVAKRHTLDDIPLANTYDKIIENKELGYVVNCQDNLDFNQYLNTLSKNTKQQWKRSTKALGQLGKIEFSVISDSNQQLDILTKTSHWHINKWKNSCTPSGFLNENFVKFHQRLINDDHTTSKTLVTTLTINEELVGCLYCLQKDAIIYFYLSNLKPLGNKKIKLGIALHMFMIQWIHKTYPRDGQYDFLAGEARYKKSLASHVDEYAQITLQKNKLLYKLERCIQKIKKLLVKH